LPFPDIPGSIIYIAQEIYHTAGQHVDQSYKYKALYKVT